MRSLRELEQAVEVVGGDRDVADSRFARRARVAGRDEHLAHERGLRCLPRERVLAAAAAHDQHSHARTLFGDTPLFAVETRGNGSARKKRNVPINAGSAACR